MKDNIENINSKKTRFPEWIRVKTYAGDGRQEVKNLVNNLGLNTVCQSAKCPNLGECWHRRTATFMILGNTCTRNCRFCAVNHGQPGAVDKKEPKKIAEAVEQIGLKYVVVTSVTRDDLPDGGASQFAETIKQIKSLDQHIGIEVLTPDFNNNISSIKTVLDAEPTVFNHNIETVERLSSEIRQKASYKTSLDVLKNAFEISEGKIPIKSGLMVGMGETDEEVKSAINDLKDVGVTMLTIGQYLPPSEQHWPLKRYVHPDIFEQWHKYAISLGFTQVASAPLVRSSYMAEEQKNAKGDYRL